MRDETGRCRYIGWRVPTLTRVQGTHVYAVWHHKLLVHAATIKVVTAISKYLDCSPSQPVVGGHKKNVWFTVPARA